MLTTTYMPKRIARLHHTTAAIAVLSLIGGAAAQEAAVTTNNGAAAPPLLRLPLPLRLPYLLRPPAVSRLHRSPCSNAWSSPLANESKACKTFLRPSKRFLRAICRMPA